MNENLKMQAQLLLFSARQHLVPKQQQQQLLSLIQRKYRYDYFFQMLFVNSYSIALGIAGVVLGDTIFVIDSRLLSLPGCHDSFFFLFLSGNYCQRRST